jgi:hypothetical protein
MRAVRSHTVGSDCVSSVWRAPGPGLKHGAGRSGMPTLACGVPSCRDKEKGRRNITARINGWKNAQKLLR